MDSLKYILLFIFALMIGFYFLAASGVIPLPR